MKAVIMAGGKGTRLRPLTDSLPKPMVPLIGRPALEYTLELLKKNGVTDAIVTLGYMPEKITDHLGDGSRYGMNITYYTEKEPLGTAGGVKQAEKELNGTFLVLSGDAYSEVDLRRAISFHNAKNSPFTLIAQPHPYPEGLGTLEIDFENRITDFIEKPTIVKPALVNTGIYVMEKEILRMIPAGPYDFGKQLLPRLVGRCYACVDYAYWSDIGTLSSYYETNKYLAKNYVEGTCRL